MLHEAARWDEGAHARDVVGGVAYETISITWRRHN